MNKVIWYLHHYAGAPSLGMSYRPYYLSKEFQRTGCKSYIIAAGFHHLLNQLPKLSSSINPMTMDGAEYIWIKTFPYKGNGLGRLLNMFSYSFKIWWYAKRLIALTGKPDVIIVSSTHIFHYLTARLVAKKYHAKLIFEVRDLWPLSLIDLLGVSKNHPLVLLMGYIERLAYKETDHVVSLLPNAFPYMQKYGLTPDRFSYIPNGIEVNEIEAALPSSMPYTLEMQRLKNAGKFIVGYLGAHGVPNALDQLISAMALLQQQDIRHIHAVLIGKGAEKKRLQTMAKDLSNITFLDPIPKAQVPVMLANFDAAFIGFKKAPIYFYGISPNKIFDYMLAGMPIVQAIDTHNSPIQQAGCGITVAAEEPSQLAKAMVQLANMPTNELTKMGLSGKEYVYNNHRYNILAKKYLQLFGVTYD